MSTRPTVEDLARQVEAWAGPLAPDVHFIQPRGGRVHVEAYNPDDAGGFPVTPDDIIDLLVGTVWTRCGKQLRRHIGGMEQSAERVSRFADEELCQRCVGSVPDAEQWRMFEHARPSDPDED